MQLRQTRGSATNRDPTSRTETNGRACDLLDRG
jgi:hypothetical protein